MNKRSSRDAKLFPFHLKLHLNSKHNEIQLTHICLLLSHQFGYKGSYCLAVLCASVFGSTHAFIFFCLVPPTWAFTKFFWTNSPYKSFTGSHQYLEEPIVNNFTILQHNNNQMILLTHFWRGGWGLLLTVLEARSGHNF